MTRTPTHTDDVRRAYEDIPDARLETVDAGHGPWLGHGEQIAQMIETFVQQSAPLLHHS